MAKKMSKIDKSISNMITSMIPKVPLTSDVKVQVIDFIQSQNNMLGSMIRKYAEYHQTGDIKRKESMEKSFPYLLSAKPLI